MVQGGFFFFPLICFLFFIHSHWDTDQVSPYPQPILEHGLTTITGYQWVTTQLSSEAR